VVALCLSKCARSERLLSSEPEWASRDTACPRQEPYKENRRVQPKGTTPEVISLLNLLETPECPRYPSVVQTLHKDAQLASSTPSTLLNRLGRQGLAASSRKRSLCDCCCRCCCRCKKKRARKSSSLLFPSFVKWPAIHLGRPSCRIEGGVGKLPDKRQQGKGTDS